MGKDTLHSIDLEGIAALGDHFGDLVVEISRLEETEGSLDSVVSSEDHIGFLSISFFLTADNSVSYLSDKTIDVDTEVDLNEIAGGEGKVLGVEGGHVADDMVGGDASGESNTLLHLFLLGVDFLDFIFDHLVAEGAD